MTGDISGTLTNDEFGEFVVTGAMDGEFRGSNAEHVSGGVSLHAASDEGDLEMVGGFHGERN